MLIYLYVMFTNIDSSTIKVTNTLHPTITYKSNSSLMDSSVNYDHISIYIIKKSKAYRLYTHIDNIYVKIFIT